MPPKEAREKDKEQKQPQDSKQKALPILAGLVLDPISSDQPLVPLNTLPNFNNYIGEFNFGLKGAGKAFGESIRGKRHEEKDAVNQDRFNTFVIKSSGAFEVSHKQITAETIAIALRKTYNELSYKLSLKPFAKKSGSTLTAVVFLRTAQGLIKISAQVGDSGAKLIFLDENRFKVESTTPVHKGNVAAEAERIRKNGLIFDEKFRVVKKTQDRDYFLDMTRSLGDLHHKPEVIDTPDIHIQTLQGDVECLLASDGLLDIYDNDFIANAYNIKEEANLCKNARNSAKNRDDTSFIRTQNLTALTEDEILALILADGHGPEGGDVSNYLIARFPNLFLDALNDELTLLNDKKTTILGDNLDDIAFNQFIFVWKQEHAATCPLNDCISKYKILALQGNPFAIANLNWLYRNTDSTDSKKRQWLDEKLTVEAKAKHKYSDKIDAIYYYLLGYRYEHGLAIEENITLAKACYEIAIKKGIDVAIDLKRVDKKRELKAKEIRTNTFKP